MGTNTVIVYCIDQLAQVTLLEGRDACEFKLKAPLKFWSGRSDCVSEDEDGRGYKAAKEENQPRLLGDAM